ncbi:hypothetical protein [Caballeronia sp. KNU42]
MSVLDEVLQANAEYQQDFSDKVELALPPARHSCRCFVPLAGLDGHR